MIDGSHLKWDDFGFIVAVRLSNNVDDDNELCEKSLNIDTPESPLIVEIVSSDVIYYEEDLSIFDILSNKDLHRLKMLMLIQIVCHYNNLSVNNRYHYYLK